MELSKIEVKCQVFDISDLRAVLIDVYKNHDIPSSNNTWHNPINTRVRVLGEQNPDVDKNLQNLFDMIAEAGYKKGRNDLRQEIMVLLKLE